MAGWRERMASRQRFWSTSHGFRMGRKLGDWGVDGQKEGAQPTEPTGAQDQGQEMEEEDVHSQDDLELQAAVQLSLQDSHATTAQQDQLPTLQPPAQGNGGAFQGVQGMGHAPEAAGVAGGVDGGVEEEESVYASRLRWQDHHLPSAAEADGQPASRLPAAGPAASRLLAATAGRAIDLRTRIPLSATATLPGLHTSAVVAASHSAIATAAAAAGPKGTANITAAAMATSSEAVAVIASGPASIQLVDGEVIVDEDVVVEGPGAASQLIRRINATSAHRLEQETGPAAVPASATGFGLLEVGLTNGHHSHQQALATAHSAVSVEQVPFAVHAASGSSPKPPPASRGTQQVRPASFPAPQAAVALEEAGMVLGPGLSQRHGAGLGPKEQQVEEEEEEEEDGLSFDFIQGPSLKRTVQRPNVATGKPPMPNRHAVLAAPAAASSLSYRDPSPEGDMDEWEDVLPVQVTLGTTLDRDTTPGALPAASPVEVADLLDPGAGKPAVLAPRPALDHSPLIAATVGSAVALLHGSAANPLKQATGISTATLLPISAQDHSPVPKAPGGTPLPASAPKHSPLAKASPFVVEEVDDDEWEDMEAVEAAAMARTLAPSPAHPPASSGTLNRHPSTDPGPDVGRIRQPSTQAIISPLLLTTRVSQHALAPAAPSVNGLTQIAQPAAKAAGLLAGEGAVQPAGNAARHTAGDAAKQSAGLTEALPAAAIPNAEPAGPSAASAGQPAGAVVQQPDSRRQASFPSAPPEEEWLLQQLDDFLQEDPGDPGDEELMQQGEEPPPDDMFSAVDQAQGPSAAASVAARPPNIDIDAALEALEVEGVALRQERAKAARGAEGPSPEMYQECQELLQLFGLPYIVAPVEAEAQCAWLDTEGLVDGVVTDDNDVFLFGGQHVYRNIFDNKRYVEEYHMRDVERELGLSRERLGELALLLGSDYTEGVAGIGIVNAVEVVHSFPGAENLQRFREWVMTPDAQVLAAAQGLTGAAAGAQDEDVSDSQREFKRTHRGVRQTWDIPETFPNTTVLAAYTQPHVDRNRKNFVWGRPDLQLIRIFCKDRFGWPEARVDELLLPVLTAYDQRQTQLRIDQFLSFNQRFAKIKSKRLQAAVQKIAGHELDEELTIAANASPGGDGEGAPAGKPPVKRKRKTSQAEPAREGEGQQGGVKKKRAPRKAKAVGQGDEGAEGKPEGGAKKKRAPRKPKAVEAKVAAEVVILDEDDGGDGEDVPVVGALQGEEVAGPMVANAADLQGAGQGQLQSKKRGRKAGSAATAGATAARGRQRKRQARDSGDEDEGSEEGVVDASRVGAAAVPPLRSPREQRQAAVKASKAVAALLDNNGAAGAGASDAPSSSSGHD